MSIEFNGDVKFNKADFSNKNKVQNLNFVDMNSEQIGELLGKYVNVDEVNDGLSMSEILGFQASKEPTSEQKEALDKLNEKVSSTGISYGDAAKKINEIREKYNDDKYYKEVMVERKQPKNIAVYYPPVKKKVFDESKLPEPARTEYREAMEAQKEIENNNTALAKKAGIKQKGKDDAPTTGIKLNPELLRALSVKPKEPTEKQKVARQKLDEKQSSTGVKYKDAKAVISKLTEKYKESCRSIFESEQPNDGRYLLPYEAFDPYKIPEPDKSAYFDALESINEIEEGNSALLAQGGLSRTTQPSQNYVRNPHMLDWFKKY